jgi:hypothetical protein
MSLRILGVGLALLTMLLAGGCHSQPRTTNYCQPNVCASPGCPPPCNTCNTPPAPGTVTAVVPGH